VSDICEAGQRGDLFVRERAGPVIILESSRNNDTQRLVKHDTELRQQREKERERGGERERERERR